MRLFLGIELTDPLRAQVDRIQSLLRPSRADVRWVDAEGAHLTLHFLGEIDEDAVRRVDEAIAAAVTGTPAIDLRLEGVGAFPDERRPRVVWVGCYGEIDKLEALHDGIGEALRRLHIGTEARRFHPHVTLGRVRSPRHLARLASLIGKLRDSRLGNLPVHEIVLFHSQLTPSGARYSAVSRYRLRAGSSPGG